MSDRKGSQRVTSFPMGDITQSRSQMIASTKQDAAVSDYNENPSRTVLNYCFFLLNSLFVSQFSGFRRVLLGLYIFIIILFVVALLVVAVFAPIEETFKSKS